MKQIRVVILSVIVGLWVKVSNRVEGFVISRQSSTAIKHQSNNCNGALYAVRSNFIREQHGAFLRFSHSFQRHIIYDANRTVLGSYEFLDNAMDDYPLVKLVQQGTQTFDNELIYLGCFAGSGVSEQSAYREFLNTTTDDHSSRVAVAYDALMTLSKLAAEVPIAQNAMALYLADSAGKLRFLAHSPETIKENYKSITRTLKHLLEIDATYIREHIMSKFPQVCIYELDDIVERLSFFLAPLPSTPFVKGKCVDWPLLASQGYGAGLTKKQLREALRGVPHILAMYYEDAVMKPSLGYYLHVLNAPFELADTARIELKDYVDGSTISDMGHITFLKSLGLSWDQLGIILAAFPTVLTCDTQPSWEMLNKGIVRKQFVPQAMHYFQTRLQIRPPQVKAMLITHTRLSTYSLLGKIKPTLDKIQSALGLTSAEMRKLILRMPSLIGMSAADGKGFHQRIDFFLSDNLMTMKDLRKAVIRQPSLLQYNVNATLRPKIAFLHDELLIPTTKLGKMIVTTPGFMGLSLDENLRPSVEYFMEYIEIEPKEMGEIVVKAPQLLASSWKSNLELKLRYLSNRLDLETPQLKKIVKTSPRLLLYSIKTSIEPKLAMIDDALRISGSAVSTKAVVCSNPSMLVTTNDELKKRLDLAETVSSESDAGIEESLLPRVGKANAEGGSSSKKLTLKNANSLKIEPRSKEKVTTTNINGDVVVRGLRGDIASSTYPMDRGHTPGVIPIIAYVAGRIFPRDSINRVRGSEQAGGTSLFFPQVAHGSPQFKERFNKIARACFGQIVPETEYGVSRDGLILVGFPGLWPSRSRCELSACHGALTAVLLLLVQEAATNPNIKNESFQVDIYTGSDYVWKLLRNSTRLAEWSEQPSIQYFRNSTEVGSKSSNNPDLLYPLTQIAKRITSSNSSLIDSQGNPIPLGKEVKLRFLHTSDGNTQDVTVQEQGSLARVAAEWYYARDNTPVL